MPITMRMAIPRMVSIPMSRLDAIAGDARSGIVKPESRAIDVICAIRRSLLALNKAVAIRCPCGHLSAGEIGNQSDDRDPVGACQRVPSLQVLCRECGIAR